MFSRFASEILTHRPAISNLKTIGTDLENAIFSDFLSNQGSKAAVIRFPSSTERQQKANGTQPINSTHKYNFS